MYITLGEVEEEVEEEGVWEDLLWVYNYKIIYIYIYYIYNYI